MTNALNRKSFACCGRHVARALQHLTNKTVMVRKVSKEHSADYTCECGKPATWYLFEPMAGATL